MTRDRGHPREAKESKAVIPEREPSVRKVATLGPEQARKRVVIEMRREWVDGWGPDGNHRRQQYGFGHTLPWRLHSLAPLIVVFHLSRPLESIELSSHLLLFHFSYSRHHVFFVF
ncbi:hypothetical protein B296_00056541 [Ensete ventricosum]|uniref:Uncharacterized protein n=1 Tax=Ensete ventricosum TaxID=4639 RepID=A0A426WXL4_ENSVE|nr:hypothetical protein B296_00056541 [Ensete ventricosum]